MDTTRSIFEYLQIKFGESLELTEAEVGQSWIQVPAHGIKEVSKFLRDDPELCFNTLMCLSGVHYSNENKLGVTYHLHSTTKNRTLVLKVNVPEDDPRVQSVESVWKTADWHEREAYDLVGVVFEGHPNLKRILTPQDWKGHPLRKDYERQESYHNVTTGP